MKIAFLLFAFSLLLFGCERQTQWDGDAFFEQSFELIKEKSIKKNEVNWVELKKAVKDSIKVFDTNEKIYNAIGYIIKLIDDGHSAFIPANTPNRLTDDTLRIPAVETQVIENDIAYIKLSGFMANDSLSKQYVLSIRKSLLELDENNNLSGWIIDLRKNAGGKTSSESLGIAPLFQDSLIGISRNNKDDYRKIFCTSKYFFWDDFKMDSLIYDSHLNNRDKKIAVLVSEQTASAGEFLTLAFSFQNNTKVFGKKTKGKTSHLGLFEFKSDAKLLLAIENYCDKNKNVMNEGIIPDIDCTPEESLSKAIEWIKKDPTANISL